LRPAPRNFTLNTGWKNGTRLEDIFRTLEQGLPGSAMVSYNYLTKADRMALVHYVQSLGPFDHGKSDPSARTALEQLIGSASEVIPSRIPVRKAASKLVHEFRPAHLLPECAPLHRGQQLVVNYSRAAQTLAATPAWDASDVALASRVTLDTPGNGFAVAASTYTLADWAKLRLCLTSH
jgi:hypothetical protein